MVKTIKKKGFTLLELLLAATLFSVAMVGIIALVTTSINTVETSQKIKKVNYAIRNFNEYLNNDIKEAECIKGSDDGLKIQIYDSTCNNLQKSIVVGNGGTLVEQSKNNDTQNLLPNNIKIVESNKNKIFEISDDSFIKIRTGFIYEDDVKTKTDYQTSITRRRW